MYWCGPSSLRLFSLQCSISRTTWTAASRTSTSRSTGRIPTPVGVGILQTHFNFIEPSVLLYILQGRCPPRVEFCFTFLQQLHATKISNPASSSLQLCFLGSQPQGGESKARDPLLRSTKGEGGVYGGQSVSRLPQGREVLARQAF